MFFLLIIYGVIIVAHAPIWSQVSLFVSMRNPILKNIYIIQPSVISRMFVSLMTKVVAKLVQDVMSAPPLIILVRLQPLK